MELDKKFRIEEDAACWILIERKARAKDKQGNKKITSDGAPMYLEERTYHANLKQACIWYLSKAQSASTDIHNAVIKMTEAEGRVLQALAK